MSLFHIDSMSTDETMYVWADSFDNAFSFSVGRLTTSPLGDIRVRQVFAESEAAQFKQPVKTFPRFYACEAAKK